MVDKRQLRRHRVFISYSRVDEAFADELRMGLEDRGYAIEIDKQSIRQGEEWKARLRKLIANCDTVVFVLSPDSARSATCHWEVDEAHREAKRIVAVAHRDLLDLPLGKQPDGKPWPEELVRAPERLSLINYPRFDSGRSFMAGLRHLVEALEADHEWIEAHSRLAARARDWDEGGRPVNRLMSGPDIDAAKHLLEMRKESAPPILPLQFDFIQASEVQEAAERSARERTLVERERLLADREAAVRQEAETRIAKQRADAEALAATRRVTRVTLAGLAAALVLAAIAGWFGYEATRTANLAREQARRAERSENAAEAAKREAQVTQSGLLSEAARLIFDRQGDIALAMLIGLEGMPDSRSHDPEQVRRPLVPELKTLLNTLYIENRERAVIAHNGPASTIVWSPNSRQLAMAGDDNTVRIVEAETGKEKERLVYGGTVYAVAWSPNGRYVALGGKNEPAVVIEVGNGEELMRMECGGPVHTVAWSPNGRFLAVASGNRHACVAEVATGKEVLRIPHDHSVPKLAWSPGGRYLATISEGHGARITDLVSSKAIAQVEHDTPIVSFAWSPSERYLATGSLDGSARITELPTGNVVARVKHDGVVFAVGWSPNESYLATGSRDNTARIIEVPTGREKRITYNASVYVVAWSPNSAYLATASADRTARIIEAETGREVSRVQHDDSVNVVVWSPGGAYVATGSDDKTAKVMLIEKKMRNKIVGIVHEAPVDSVIWSFDGQYLITKSRDETVRIVENNIGKEGIIDPDLGIISARVLSYFVDPQALVDASKTRAGRCLTQSQRKQYFLPPAPPTWCIERRLWPYHGDDWQAFLSSRKAWLASSRQGPEPELPAAK